MNSTKPFNFHYLVELRETIDCLQFKNRILLLTTSLFFISSCYFFYQARKFTSSDNPESRTISIPMADSSKTEKDIELIKKILASLVPAVDRLSKEEKVVQVTGEKAVLREQPKGKVIGQLSSGTSLVELSRQDDWVKISSPLGGESFVHQSSVSK